MDAVAGLALGTSPQANNELLIHKSRDAEWPEQPLYADQLPQNG
jgi:hypothetical protein